MYPAIEEIRRRASSVSRRIVYPSPDERVIQALGTILQDGVALPILLGNKPSIESELRRHRLSESGLEVVDPNSERPDGYVDIMLETLRAQGIQQTELRQRLKDPAEYALAMVRGGDAHGLVAGPAAPERRKRRDGAVGLNAGRGRPCRCFLVALPEDDPRNALLFADGMTVAAPRPFELAEIALEACRCVRELFQTESKVGFLAPSVVASLGRQNKFDSAADLLECRVEQAIDTLQARDADLAVDRKLYSRIPTDGSSNIYVFVDRQPGNPGYQIGEMFDGARVVGPFIRGLDRPLNEVGIGCSVQDVIDITAITVLS